MIPSELLLTAYSAGYFPMADSRDGEIHWYSPDPRAIIPLDTFKISRSLKQTIKKNIFEIRIDHAFEDVIRSCAKRDETWISEEIVQSYLELHRLGYAHSIESWHNKKLVGGLYGVALGGAFFGESMFSLMKDASKVALVALVETLKERGFKLLDTQYTTPHLKNFGVVEISRQEYLKKLKTVTLGQFQKFKYKFSVIDFIV
ncbi:MAG: leucyl/phenylalanyl-tRNA--protein transferase, partial [Bacteroidota bacterium]|nr:leucyl/phenylalanyl-tRNA--protein transferase [Bacteroidota bacterium]